MPLSRPAERGSILIYIFIAIIALAALTFAVSSNNREGMSTVDRERSELLATQVLDYTGMIRRAIQTMKVDGIADTDICFDSPRWGHTDYDHSGCIQERNKLFSIGGAVWQDPSLDIFDSALQSRPDFSQWIFSGANAVVEVGTDCPTTGDAECNELLVMLPYIKDAVCLALNKRLQADATGVIPVNGDSLNVTARYDGNFVNGETIDIAALHGKRSGCFKTTSTPAFNVFFAVLSAR